MYQVNVHERTVMFNLYIKKNSDNMMCCCETVVQYGLQFFGLVMKNYKISIQTSRGYRIRQT